MASFAVLALAGTYVAAQIDLVRRHTPGIAPTHYWLPQLAQIWRPGLAAAAIFALAAFVLHRASGAK
jgi:hypothetical protein